MIILIGLQLCCLKKRQTWLSVRFIWMDIVVSRVNLTNSRENVHLLGTRIFSVATMKNLILI